MISEANYEIRTILGGLFRKQAELNKRTGFDPSDAVRLYKQKLRSNHAHQDKHYSVADSVPVWQQVF